MSKNAVEGPWYGQYQLAKFTQYNVHCMCQGNKALYFTFSQQLNNVHFARIPSTSATTTLFFIELSLV